MELGDVDQVVGFRLPCDLTRLIAFTVTNFRCPSSCLPWFSQFATCQCRVVTQREREIRVGKEGRPRTNIVVLKHRPKNSLYNDPLLLKRKAHCWAFKWKPQRGVDYRRKGNIWMLGPKDKVVLKKMPKSIIGLQIERPKIHCTREVGLWIPRERLGKKVYVGLK